MLSDLFNRLVTVNYLTDNLPAADAFILSQVLHASNDATAVELLTKIYNALNKSKQFYQDV